MSVALQMRCEVVVVRVRRFRWEWSMTETWPAHGVSRGHALTRWNARAAALKAADLCDVGPAIREEFALVKVRNSREAVVDQQYMALSKAEREFAEADAAGRIVPVSDHVARLMTGAQAAERKRKRKAAKRARRRNR